MNKIYKLCEYGISVYTVQKLKKYSLEELEYNIDELNDIKGIGEGRKKQIQNILKSEEFKNDTEESVYELCEYGFNLNQIQILYEKKVVLSNITEEYINGLDISKQLKSKLNGIKIENKNQAYEGSAQFDKLLEKEIKKILEPFEIISVNALKNEIVKKGTYPIKYFISDLNLLKNRNIIEMSSEGIYYRIPSLNEGIEKIIKEKDKIIFKERLEGKTLAEIGKKYGMTRERIRQIAERAMKQLPVVKEDKLKSMYSTYNWSEKVFCDFFNVNYQVYNYLDLKYKKGVIELNRLYDNEEIDERQEKILDEYLNYVEIYDKKIFNNNENILREFIKNEAIELISIEELYEKYQRLTQMYNLNSIEGFRNFEAVLSRKNYVLNNLNKKIRFYDISRVSDKDKQKLSNILDCEPGEYSALHFFKLYNDLMQELDIRNEYELHNLIRILEINNKDNLIVLNKMPHIFIGINDKKIFFEEHLRELAPITIEEAAMFFYEEYGHKIESTKSYIRLEFRKYLNDNVIRFDVDKLDDETLMKIKNRVNGDLCSISNVKEIFKMIVGDNYLKYFNSYNVSKIGYKIKGEYIQKDSINNLEDYIIKKMKDKKIIYLEDIPLYWINSIYNVIRNCENEFRIIKISDKKYLNYKVLEEAGIEKKILKEYGERAKKEYLPGEFFTLYSLRNKLGENSLDKEGFDDIFYESLIFHTKGIRKISLDNNNVFYISINKGRYEYSAKDFIKDIIGVKEGIRLSEVINILEDDYGLIIENEYLIIELIRENKYYYNNTLNKIYTSKLAYLNDIYEED